MIGVAKGQEIFSFVYSFVCVLPRSGQIPGRDKVREKHHSSNDNEGWGAIRIQYAHNKSVNLNESFQDSRGLAQNWICSSNVSVVQ